VETGPSVAHEGCMGAPQTIRSVHENYVYGISEVVKMTHLFSLFVPPCGMCTYLQIWQGDWKSARRDFVLFHSSPAARIFSEAANRRCGGRLPFERGRRECPPRIRNHAKRPRRFISVLPGRGENYLRSADPLGRNSAPPRIFVRIHSVRLMLFRRSRRNKLNHNNRL